MTIKEQLVAIIDEYDNVITTCESVSDRTNAPKIIMPIFLPIDNTGELKNSLELVFDTNTREPIELKIPQLTIKEGDQKSVIS